MGRASGTEPTTSPVRRLVLLRHAKAEPPSELPDEQRPLALRGRDQAVKVGAALVASGLVPDAVLVSGAVRTRQTWDLARKHLGEPPVAFTDDLLGAMPRGVLALVRELDPASRTVLVIGHEPAMAGTAELAGRPGVGGRRARAGPRRRPRRRRTRSWRPTPRGRTGTASSPA